MGIAGPAAAYWLLRHGFVPTIVERAPKLRTGGYIIDFWGLGYDIAEKMGVLPDLLETGYQIREVRIVNRHGRRVAGFDARVLRNAAGGRFTSLPRGDLSAILHRAIDGRIETLFANSVMDLKERPDGVAVRFEHGVRRHFNLVIGADGLHSGIRLHTFGPEDRFERFLGYAVAAFTAKGYRPRDPDVYVAYSVPGRQVARFAMHGDDTMILMIVSDDGAARGVDPNDLHAQKAYLRSHFADAGWECRKIVDSLDASDDLYFDRVSQIRMDHWTKGRVALVGDAAFAPSLLAGQGSALAMIAVYILAGELARARSHQEAFGRYEARLSGFMRQKQNAAEQFAGSMAPKTRFGIFVRNQVTKTFGLPLVGKLIVGRSVSDELALPDY
jgi:2-polyprenyl-6-methoxyphenol hydroxylase-like FAD-dependent oxidoreductase